MEGNLVVSRLLMKVRREETYSLLRTVEPRSGMNVEVGERRFEERYQFHI